ncbi:P-loop containing nucleoside triphosphate hydrolase protein [Rhizopus microsporus var. microsporus]|uniref:Guanine nucleotide-binding protein-like 1 n=1 Tax=Rhizopus microsporus var. microsporus TaxID=86635 RepID=A0A1X0RGB9_RHIZD|nr:P-loop containing nucleoside triphosphate hydrolase protein [Rhizopus microsporus var. microsporus]
MDPSSFDYLGKTKPLKANLLDHFVQGTEGVLKNSSDLDTKTKLVSVFDKLTPQAIEQEKLASMQPLNRLPKESLELKESDLNEYIEFPKRPFWDYDMSKEEVEQHETESFQNWLKDVQEKYAGKQISWFERNLEVWRQLWRVLEISDVILIVMDIRNPLLHFPISLYNFITYEKKKSIVGVFNKVDLVSEFTVFAWKKYFEETFPNLHIATFSCFPRDKNLIDDTVTYALKNQAKRPRKRYYHAQGVKNILSVCRDVLDKPDVPVNWDSIISRYDEDSEHDEEEEEDSDDSDTESINGLDDEFSGILKVTSRAVHPHKDYITLGLVGHPNVGKSSLINSIMRKTVVSASRTPGHTKHFQTIYIADNVRLCDSPGLVFPALIPRALQIISGMYPIAQVQEPYSAIRYLAERIPLEKILSLTPPDFSRDYQWSAWTICEAFAEQRGFHTAKAAQPDVYRAANAILRLTADGRILLSFKPPGFFTSSKYEILRVTEADSNRDNSDDEDKKEERPMVITGGGFSALASDSE